ncbi:uncharacterized protein LOC108021877 [Drosophila biarmipes]|uniref:uncharacterized protein LOC108021877 n=1 Tax=Drosophila biarmipes TaxID=125945 RepID=UPI0007E7F233|nr:uncharacterized protein LOC108021877 [Drosophila biarmipes]
MDPATALLIIGAFAAYMSSLEEPKCQLNTSPSAPLIVTTNGSHTVLSPYTGLIERNNSQEIQFYCGTGFIFQNDGQDQFVSEHRLETLVCQKDGSFLLKKHQRHIKGDKRSVRCRNGVAGLYQSRTSLPNCKDQSTLVLGHDFRERGSIRSAALCYDIAKAHLRYITYATHPGGQRVLEKTHLGELNNLGLDVRVSRLSKMASQADVDAFWSKEKLLSQMFGTGPFDYASLVQDQSLGAQLAGYEDMMSVVWLHSLRTGNWRHWLAALRSASESGDQFEVRLGVSGSVELPDGRELAIGLADGQSLSVPAYIWAHVRALRPAGASQDEFVLVGHNSPFFRNDPSAELCPSMCDQVSWLKDTLFAGVHRYPINGLMMCCRVADVAQKLDSFYGSEAQTTGTTEDSKALEVDSK